MTRTLFLTILLTGAAPGALAQTPIGGTLTRTMDVEFADLNGDGAPELIRAVEGGTNQVLDWSGAAASPSDTFRFAEDASDSEDLTVADLDGDSWPDLVVANEDTLTPQLYLNDAGGGLIDASDRLGFEARSNAVIAFDADADGDLDLMFGDTGANAFLRNDGAARFELEREAAPDGDDVTQDLEAADVDGDGDLDLIVANEDANRLMLNDGRGGFIHMADALGEPRPDEETREADFGDVDGDGDLDLYFANVGFRTQSPSGAPDRLLINDGTGRFTDESAARLPDWSAHTLDVEFLDLDRDGDLDIVLAASFGGGVRALINDGGGVFETGEILEPGALDGLDAELTPGGDALYVAAFRSNDHLFEIR